jgi:hypothetical protein
MIRALKTWCARRRAFKTALSFNRLHTYVGPNVVGGSWMCPSCGAVHGCISTSHLSGRQFHATGL